jgi:hypothetical protein
MTQRRPSVSANAVGASRHMRNPDCNQLLGPGRQRPIGEDLPPDSNLLSVSGARARPSLGASAMREDTRLEPCRLSFLSHERGKFLL